MTGELEDLASAVSGSKESLMKAFGCFYCGCSFASDDELYDHMEREHNIPMPIRRRQLLKRQLEEKQMWPPRDN